MGKPYRVAVGHPIGYMYTVLSSHNNKSIIMPNTINDIIDYTNNNKQIINNE